MRGPSPRGSAGIDVGIRLGPRVEGPLVAARLPVTRYHVVASPAAYVARSGRPARPADLAGHDGIVFPLPGYRSRRRLRRRGGRGAVEEEAGPRAALDRVERPRGPPRGA